MKREDILKLAREQGLPETATEGVFIVNTDDLGRVLSAERKACAEIAAWILKMPQNDVSHHILARGNK